MFRFTLLFPTAVIFLGFLPLPTQSAESKLRAPTIEFEVVAQYLVKEGNAEVIQAAGNGNFIVHTNSDHDSIDVVDIRDIQKPALVASLSMPGEPTSVGVSPDGNWAMAVVYTAISKKGKKPKDPRIPGALALVDLRDPFKAHIETIIGIGHHPDSIAVTAKGDELLGIVAIENEPLIVENGKVVGSDKPGQKGDISERGAVQFITLDPLQPERHSVLTVRLDEALMKDAGMLFPTDPQPEYVALSRHQPLVAISLQENNGIILLDITTGEIKNAFNLGIVADRPADLLDDKNVAFDQVYPRDAVSQKLAGARFPDGISYSPKGDYLLSADEGDLELTGGRGFSIWSLEGEFIWDDGGEIERRAHELGLYPDKRSAIRGIEVEGVTTAKFRGREYAFVISERGSFVAIYDISNPTLPLFRQIVSTATGPESAVAIPSRNLLLVAAEKGNAVTIIGVKED